MGETLIINELIAKTADIDLADLPMSIRLYNCLRRGGYATLTDVMIEAPDKFSQIRNFGKTSEQELMTIIQFARTASREQILDYCQKKGMGGIPEINSTQESAGADEPINDFSGFTISEYVLGKRIDFSSVMFQRDSEDYCEDISFTDLVQIRRPIKADTYEYVENSPQLVCEPETVYMPSRPAIPKWLELRKYQKNAIAAWVKNNNRGIFQMATGTGKTKTSLAAVTKILDVYYSNQVKCGLVVVVPYVVLLEQWLEDLKEFQISAIACYESKNKWLPRVEENIRLFNENVRDKLFLITTTKTLISSDFQRCIATIKGDYIFLADEMHHLTSDMMRQSLPQNAKYRLGLSATLMTKYNSAKMEELKAYFGGIIYEYSMKEAIETDCLTRYFYYPIYVELTDEEKSDYYEVSKKISKAMMLAGNDLDDDDNIPLKALLSQRGRILASASNKLIKLKEMAPQFKDKANLIIYCGDKIESNVKYIDKVYEIVNNEEGIISAKFTAEENPQQRRDILHLFGKKVIQALIAIRCLDEGVDIPQLETAIIMSSGTNPKEFIQRRGRILRKAAGKQYSYIYDFIVIPSLSIQDVSALTPDEKEMELKVISREFERVQEFANLAENGLEVTASFLEKWRQYSGGMDNA